MTRRRWRQIGLAGLVLAIISGGLAAIGAVCYVDASIAFTRTPHATYPNDIIDQHGAKVKFASGMVSVEW